METIEGFVTLEQDILGHLASCSSGCPTYVIANSIFPRMNVTRNTTAVRNACKRLEKAGKVKRVRTNSLLNISWGIA